MSAFIDKYTSSQKSSVGNDVEFDGEYIFQVTS